MRCFVPSALANVNCSKVLPPSRIPPTSSPVSKTILILSDEPLVATLLATLVELEGYRPEFARDDELSRDALERLRPAVVLVDCDRPETCEDDFLSRAAATGAGVVLFSPARLQDEVERIAEERGLLSFSLPVHRGVLQQVLRDASMALMIYLSAGLA